MSAKSSKESSVYGALGASSSKDAVHRALGHSATQSHSYFAVFNDDVCGDPNYFSLLHADSAGTKTIVAYLAFRETGDPRWFKSLAQDALVMNLDDIACVNAFESIALSNSIARNRSLIPDEAIGVIISGYREQVAALEKLGIKIALSGGETEDLGDVVRTLLISCTLFARVPRAQAISTDRICGGDVIVGLASTGQASYEQEPNSGLGSNGYTLARHALIAPEYLERYPEIVDPLIDTESVYQGKWKLFDTPKPLQMNIAQSLLSPTRTYAPLVMQIAKELGNALHGAIHCTGGGQTKITRFGKNKRYIKDNLFPCPAINELIQESLKVPWEEMYAVFNMGHRMEIVCPPNRVREVVQIAKGFEIEARQIGYVEDSNGVNELEIRSPYGTFRY